jgi:hypothetical protein
LIFDGVFVRQVADYHGGRQMWEWEYYLEWRKDLLREAEKAQLLRNLRRTGTHGGNGSGVVFSMMRATGRTMVRVGVWLESFGKSTADCVEGVG